MTPDGKSVLALFQVTVNCANPETLADFWAEAIGYEKVDHSQRIASHPDWAGRYALVKRPDDQSLGPWLLHFQRVADKTKEKNSFHLDLVCVDVPRHVERLRNLGATVVEERHDFDDSWVVMADPEGNEFCVAWQPGSRPVRSPGS